MNRKFKLTPNNMNRSVYRSIREGNKIIVHSSAPKVALLDKEARPEVASNDTSVVEEKSTVATNKTSTASTKYYTVKKGDNLGSIARKNHTTVKKLCQLNGINTNTTLKIGRKLRVK